jgi:serine protease Do
MSQHFSDRPTLLGSLVLAAQPPRYRATVSIADDLIDFFVAEGGVSPRTISEFISTFSGYSFSDVLAAIRKLEERGLLLRIGVVSGHPAITGSMLLSVQTAEVRASRRMYGTYRFYVEGWSGIRESFAGSVVKIDVTTSDHQPGIGSGFTFLKPNIIVTARHCVQGMSATTVVASDGRQIDVESDRWNYHPRGADVAVAILNESIGAPFLWREPKVLDQVLTLGYPNIPGFEPPLVAECAEIAAQIYPLVASVGTVSATALSYLDHQSYWLITAKVKGGNSGGPVIGDDGFVVGLVSSLTKNADQPDHMGYQAAVSSREIMETITSATGFARSSAVTGLK